MVYDKYHTKSPVLGFSIEEEKEEGVSNYYVAEFTVSGVC
jgi:hypothetical protein